MRLFSEHWFPISCWLWFYQYYDSVVDDDVASVVFRRYSEEGKNKKRTSFFPKIFLVTGLVF